MAPDIDTYTDVAIEMKAASFIVSETKNSFIRDMNHIFCTISTLAELLTNKKDRDNNRQIDDNNQNHICRQITDINTDRQKDSKTACNIT